MGGQGGGGAGQAQGRGTQRRRDGTSQRARRQQEAVGIDSVRNTRMFARAVRDFRNARPGEAVTASRRVQVLATRAGVTFNRMLNVIERVAGS